MSNRHNQNDKQYERQLEQMLAAAYADGAPSTEFQEKLLRQLDREFTDLYLTSDQPTALDSPAVTDALAASNAVQSSTEKTPRRLVSLRLAMSMAVAASLLLVVALWNGQNAYGWASMLRALESCDWVRAVSDTAGVGGWVSSQRGVLAIKTDHHVAFHDSKQQVSSQYLAEHGVIQQQKNSAHASARSASDQLFLLLLNDDPGANPHAASEDLSQYRIVSESWQALPDQGGEAVELRVTLLSPGANRKTHQLSVLLDPETHLPKSVRLLAHKDEVTKSLDFEYPANGPESIFELGVPRETRVVRSLTELQNEPANAQETESSRIAAASQLRLEAFDSQGPQARIASTPGPALQAEVKPLETPLLDSAGQSADRDIPIATQTIRPEVIVTLPKDIEPAVTEDATDPGENLASESSGEPLVASNPQRLQREMPTVRFAATAVSPQALVESINEQLRDYWQSQSVQVAEPASETEFLRRVYLDLTGRIPVPFEVYAYLENDPDSRREQLVDELLASRDHATHLATVWRKLLLPAGVDTNTYGGTGKFDEWLADRFEKNIPYDQLVRQLLLAEGRVSDSGPILFYAALKLNPEELAAKTARTFLGMRMECAQCHDHPFDDSISQEDFWGFAAHFAQISRPKGKIEMTSSVLRVRDNQHGEVMLPDSDEVVPPHLPYQLAIEATRATDEQPQQASSRREQLVEWLTTKQNGRFARATVNRAWQHLFGLGLVEPADDMRADNPATCPELLDTLSHDFAASNYDLRRLLRALVLSDAYQLSSRATSDEPSQALMFARMNIKSLSADQLYDCIHVATEPDMAGADQAANGALARFGNTARQAFIEQFKAPPGQRTNYHAGIPQALTLMHGRLVHGATDLSSSGLLKSIGAPFFTDEQRIETLFLSTLSRFPEPEEQQKMLAHVQAATGETERSRAFGDILWALLNSAEFTFIH